MDTNYFCYLLVRALGAAEVLSGRASIIGRALQISASHWIGILRLSTARRRSSH